MYKGLLAGILLLFGACSAPSSRGAGERWTGSTPARAAPVVRAEASDLDQPLSAAASGSFWERLDNDASAEKTAFVGGRGLITAETPSGMFLNPTSGTAPKGTVTVNVCAATFEPPGGGSVTGTALLTTYAIRDWLEVGGAGFGIENDGHGPGIGPVARFRFLKEERDTWMPEACVGFYGFLGGTDPLKRTALFVAASKEWDLPGSKDRSWLEAFRLHLGLRQNWREIGEDDTVGYFGGEVALWRYLYFVSEVSTEDNNGPHTPYSFGLQVRHPDGIGFSLAGMQPGFSSDIGIYVGIGIGFDF